VKRIGTVNLKLAIEVLNGVQQEEPIIPTDIADNKTLLKTLLKTLVYQITKAIQDKSIDEEYLAIMLGIVGKQNTGDYSLQLNCLLQAMFKPETQKHQLLAIEKVLDRLNK